MFLLFIVAYFCLYSISNCTNVALFPSTGCYSHDVMMKEIGLQFDKNVTWIQTYLYEFGFGPIRLPAAWNRLSIHGVDERGQKLHEQSGRLIWRQNVPFDFERPFQWSGIRSFIIILQRHQQYCEKMLDSNEFQHLLAAERSPVDVAIVDHFLQECMGGLAHLLKSPVVQFSNWPIADGYITSLNVPANPSFVPKTGTRLSSRRMTFLQRCQNVLFHVAIVFTRMVQMATIDGMFARRGYPQIRVQSNEAQRVIYGGRSELLFDTIRPISNRVKFFGASSNLNPLEYVTSCNSTRRPELTASLERVGETRANLANKHADIDWDRLDSRSFVLVSFGSVAQISKMHVRLLESILSTFAEQQHLVIWQSDISEHHVTQFYNVTIPSNVMLIPWVPVKHLLAHTNIAYIICHGGINTINEILVFGVPLLGIPLQGDQTSNLARLVDLGAGRMMSIHELNANQLGRQMKEMDLNIDRYWERSTKLSRMLASHRRLNAGFQKFWIEWVARHGKTIENRKFLRFRYIGDEENLFVFELFVCFVVMCWMLL